MFFRNIGILFGFLAFLTATYIYLAEIVTSKKSKGEVLVFRRNHAPAFVTNQTNEDIETGSGRTLVAEKSSPQEKSDIANVIQRQTAIFSWKDVTYDVKVCHCLQHLPLDWTNHRVEKIKSETRRILDHVDGWVQPGTLTALMGVSG